ncbi:PilN domain-containing protein [Kamptonema cortianum]|nr:PilN domain-containing protein [Geitlerinema splendidum]MDK3156017.1 PilN domain-containing protein [Kamptonema cortianum]
MKLNVPVIEWNPEACRGYNPATGMLTEFGSPSEVLLQLGRPGKIAVALGRGQTFLKQTRLPQVSKEDSLALLKFRLSEMFPVDSDDLAYDIVLTDDVNSEGRLVLVVAAKAQTVRQCKSVFKEAGSSVTSVLPVALGSSAIIDSESAAAVVVQKSAEGVTFDVIEHGQVAYARVAQRVETANSITQEISRTLATAKLPTAEVIAAGGIDYPEANRHIGENSLIGLCEQTNLPNLQLPEDVVKMTTGRVIRSRQVAMLCIAFALIGSAFAYFGRQDQMKTVVKAKQQQQRELRAINEKIAGINARLNAFEERDGWVSDGLLPKQYMSDAAVVVSNAVPDGVWLTGLNIERGKDIQVRGTARTNEQVASYVDRLAASDRLRDVKLAFSNNGTIGDVDVVQFSIAAHLIGNFPLKEPVKPKRGSRN